jgi:hypothetical protein
MVISQKLLPLQQISAVQFNFSAKRQNIPRKIHAKVRAKSGQKNRKYATIPARHSP